MPWAPLRVQSWYSLLRGTDDPIRLCRAAADRGLTALALADTDTVAGAVRFWDEAKECGLAPALGSVLGGFADLYARLQTPTAWASVRDQARFVLRPYASRASAAERSAAEQLVSRLESYAERPRNAE